MNDLHLHDETSALTADAAHWFLRRLAEAQKAGRRPHVALTGGSIAPAFHAEVSSAADSLAVDLDAVDWWWGDERFVARASDERNDLSALRDLLEPSGVPHDRIHRVPSSDDVETVEEAAVAYTEALRVHGAQEFEVVVLGLGPDGHVASLFPGQDQVELTRTGAVAVHDSPKPPPLRVSLTMPTLLSARSVLFMASGEGKAEAVAAAHAPGPVLECPARGVRGWVETAWFLDRDAAAGLTQS